ncbi:MAG: hypothetical protein NTY98_09105 [Verrucomicrobia bacterium]|nr:hypothetical protein [Verrucomicrobiota bacterium]
MNKLPGFGHLVAMAKISTEDFKVGACMQPAMQACQIFIEAAASIS